MTKFKERTFILYLQNEPRLIFVSSDEVITAFVDKMKCYVCKMQALFHEESLFFLKLTAIVQSLLTSKRNGYNLHVWLLNKAQWTRDREQSLSSSISQSLVPFSPGTLLHCFSWLNIRLPYKRLLSRGIGLVAKMPTQGLVLRWGYYNHAIGQVANLFNKVILCVQRHATMAVQVFTNPFIGQRIMKF